MCKEGAPLGVFRYPSYVQDIMGYVLTAINPDFFRISRWVFIVIFDRPRESLHRFLESKLFCSFLQQLKFAFCSCLLRNVWQDTGLL